MKRDTIAKALIGWAIIFSIIMSAKQCHAQHIDGTIGISSRQLMPSVSANAGTLLMESQLGARLRIGATITGEPNWGTATGGYVGYQGYGVVAYAGAAHFIPGGAIPTKAAPHLITGLQIFDTDDDRGHTGLIEIRYMANFRQKLHVVYLTMGVRIGR